MMSLYSEVAFKSGAAQKLTPLIRRVVALDEAARGFAGTRTFIVGQGDVAVIDPDPPRPALLDAILKATKGETVSHVLVSHSHAQPSPLAMELASRTGASIHTGRAGPGLALRDGERLGTGGWTLEALATPGHTGDHFAFALLQENVLFAGDCVSGWSPGLVIPPGGDLGQHLTSLEKIRRRRFSVLWPAHGPAVTDVEPFLADCLDHSRRRERQILSAIGSGGACSAWQLAGELQPRVHGLVQPAAAYAILAHLVHLAGQGRLIGPSRPALHAPFAAALRQAA